ncbi:MAG: neutral zinc metallopeptidase [Actinobacteria bacterium]|nr:neutral zinc metallopeptidase [Actinomycetota bacterium]
MRLDDVEASDIEVRKGGAGKVAAGGGGIVAIIVAVLFALSSGGGGGSSTGSDPLGQILSQMQGGGTVTAEGETVDGTTLAGQQKFTGQMMTLLDDYWADAYPAMTGDSLVDPTFVVFDGPTSTGGCGVAQPQAGPFYCPGDQKIYVDLGFYQQLEQQLGFGGDFAMAYVIAHEYGHHIQNLQGTLGGSQSNEQSVRVELQADCYAGAWASQAKADGRLEAGDFDEAITAAEAVGDDAIQGAGADRDTFTHGSSAERERWFRQGFDSADPATCTTGA